MIIHVNFLYNLKYNVHYYLQTIYINAYKTYTHNICTQAKIHIQCYPTSSSSSSKDTTTFCFSFFAFFFTGLSVTVVSESVSAALVLRNIIFLDRSAGALFSSAIDNSDRTILKITCLYDEFCYITLSLTVQAGSE